MPEYLRAKRKGGTYFFTLVTEGRRRFLTLPFVLPLLKESYGKVREKHPFELEAYVLLPDHIHCLVTLPSGDDDYSMKIMQFKRYFTLRASRLLQGYLGHRSESRIAKRESGVWQRRFWEHCIRDETDLQNHADYIAYNPVKHGYVSRVEDWPYCSISSRLRDAIGGHTKRAHPTDLDSDWHDLPAGE